MNAFAAEGVRWWMCSWWGIYRLQRRPCAIAWGGRGGAGRAGEEEFNNQAEMLKRKCNNNNNQMVLSPVSQTTITASFLPTTTHGVFSDHPRGYWIEPVLCLWGKRWPSEQGVNERTNERASKMHGYPVMQVVQYSVPPPPCPWAAPSDVYRTPSFGKQIKRNPAFPLESRRIAKARQRGNEESFWESVP